MSACLEMLCAMWSPVDHRDFYILNTKSLSLSKKKTPVVDGFEAFNVFEIRHLYAKTSSALNPFPNSSTKNWGYMYSKKIQARLWDSLPPDWGFIVKHMKINKANINCDNKRSWYRGKPRKSENICILSFKSKSHTSRSWLNPPHLCSPACTGA